MSRLAQNLPRPLYDDIVHGRWLPVVGAGLSRNARVPSGQAPPDWVGLATKLRTDLADPEDALDAVDVISAYAQEHGRSALIERVAREIRVADAEPGPVHAALCRLPIDIIMTTNFDNLLEHAFRQVQKPCHPVLDEMQLAINNPFPGPSLLKIHGDISRPERMVLTEEDFDRFLIRNPLLATVVASHFAQRSVVLIGYSLSDPDLRQLLGLVRERLGAGARAIYALEVDAPAAKIARFDRRHVKVVSLPGDRNNPEPTLRALFEDLFRAVGEEGPATLVPRTHEGGLALRAAPRRHRGCFLSASLDGQADYIEWLGPVADRMGVPLLSAFDFVSPGDSLASALDAMISSAGSAVIEIGPTWRQWEVGAALNRLGRERLMIVASDADRLPSDLAGTLLMRRPTSQGQWAAFADTFENWLRELYGQSAGTEQEDVYANFVGRVMLLSSTLERQLGDRLGLPLQQRSLSRAIRAAASAGLLDSRDESTLMEFAALRNRVAHGRPDEMSSRARGGLVKRVETIIKRLDSGE